MDPELLSYLEWVASLVVFGAVSWEMLSYSFNTGLKQGKLFARVIDAKAIAMTKVLDDIAETSQAMQRAVEYSNTRCNYTTDTYGNIVFRMNDILPVILNKLTTQGDLIIKDGPQHIGVGVNEDADGETVLLLNVKDSCVREVSNTRH